MLNFSVLPINGKINLVFAKSCLILVVIKQKQINMKTMITTIALVLSISLRAQTCTINNAPMGQVVANCNVSSIQHVTITASPANVSFTISNPFGTSVTSTTNPTDYHPIGAGTYTVKLLDTNTGCTNAAQFSVGSASTYPVFSLSPSNFTLGCAPKDLFIATINTISSSPGAPTYTMLPPGASTSVPNAQLSIQNNYNINQVGTWTAVVRGNNGCQTRVPFTVTFNTVVPTYTLSNYTKTLTCVNLTTTITGLASVSATISNIAVSAPGNYSVIVTDTNNACSTSTVISIFQNIVTPTLNIAPSWTLDCASGSVLVEPINANTSYQYNWIGGANTASFAATAAGGYTLNTVNPVNGCSLASSVTVYTCSTTGIEEYRLNPNAVFSYTDLMGRPMEKQMNVPMIEWVRVGDRVYSRKFMINN